MATIHVQMHETQSNAWPNMAGQRGNALTNGIIANNDALLSLGTGVTELGRLSFLQDSVRDAGDASSFRDIGARQYHSAQQSVEQRRFACEANKTTSKP